MDLVKFADQVPAKPPGSMSAALAVSETAMREKAKIMNRIFMADMIIQIDKVSIPFLSPIKMESKGPRGRVVSVPL